MRKELDALFTMIENLDTAMLTTRRRDGHMVSRAMANQKRTAGADLWFVTLDSSGKLDDLESDPHVNLAYYKDRTREWVSVSGIATLSRDRGTIHELYARDWSMWFADEGDPRHGTPDDPRLVLIGVDVHAASFLELDRPQPVVLFEVVKGWVTGDTPDLGEVQRVEN